MGGGAAVDPRESTLTRQSVEGRFKNDFSYKLELIRQAQAAERAEERAEETAQALTHVQAQAVKGQQHRFTHGQSVAHSVR
jgi:hypothetical protein